MDASDQLRQGRSENADSGAKQKNDVPVELRVRKEKLGETWSTIQVLHLDFVGEHVDIGPLECLRELHLEADKTLKTFDCSQELKELRSVKFTCLQGEVRRVLPNFKAPRLEHLEMNFNLAALEWPGLTLPVHSPALSVLKVSKWHSKRQQEVLNLKPFPNLTELEVTTGGENFLESCTLSLWGLNALTKLKILYLTALPIEGPFLGLENLSSLEALVLQLCCKITALPGLGALTNLVHLSVSGTQVPDLTGAEKLLELRELYCTHCKKLQLLPDLSALRHLWIADVAGCDLLLDQRFSVPATCFVPPWAKEDVQAEKQAVKAALVGGPKVIMDHKLRNSRRRLEQFQEWFGTSLANEGFVARLGRDPEFQVTLVTYSQHLNAEVANLMATLT